MACNTFDALLINSVCYRPAGRFGFASKFKLARWLQQSCAPRSAVSQSVQPPPTYVVMEAASSGSVASQPVDTLRKSVSGTDQLKQEKLRFAAVNALASTEDFWDSDSDEDAWPPVKRAECRQAVSAPVHEAQVADIVDSEDAGGAHSTSCYSHLPEHAAIAAAVRAAIQSHSTVSFTKLQQTASFCCS